MERERNALKTDAVIIWVWYLRLLSVAYGEIAINAEGDGEISVEISETLGQEVESGPAFVNSADVVMVLVPSNRMSEEGEGGY